jgi:hypothetical protein
LTLSVTLMGVGSLGIAVLVDHALPPIAAMRSVIDSVHRAMETHTKFFGEGG